MSLAEFFPVDDVHIMCTKPPQCVLFHPLRTRNTNPTFNGIEEGVLPVFPIDRSIRIKDFSIRRKQVPICAAFSLTDYKVQGQTFTKAVLDLKTNPTTRARDSFRNFCSFNVQVSRLQEEDGLNLLQEIEMSDITYQPHKELISEMSRLETLEKRTLETWVKNLDATEMSRLQALELQRSLEKQYKNLGLT